MTNKKLYVWKLADFLRHHGMTMSGDELAEHLNRNGIHTNYGSSYEGKRGTYTLIRETWRWAADELGSAEADKVAKAFVLPNGAYAYDKQTPRSSVSGPENRVVLT
ncbi:hypothetical protein AMJ82_05675 [candidate division TA06 bacterium SM23_40]|uniref:Uncharacterized protein n=1 Tax=candidate division TA06 bacterium SM23_40 TaxID=1703774 RepID=A0A0S8G8P4_UNCT6|nr:MAG: hypothetical protein AMJ82_05675 [candidate division TA06 bacterium SM23_40]